MYFDLIIAGFGGQGVLFSGNLLAEAAMADGFQVTYMPVYGVEMRGGTANCTVVVADGEIGSPVVQHPVSAIAMNKPSLVKFGPRVRKDGLLLINGSLVEPGDINYNKVKTLVVPAMELAQQVGNDRLANMVMLGALVEKTGITSIASLTHAMTESLPERARKMIPVNVEALEQGARFAREQE